MGKFGYCDTCKHDGECCIKCYRGSYYEYDWDKGERSGQYYEY